MAKATQAEAKQTCPRCRGTGTSRWHRASGAEPVPMRCGLCGGSGRCGAAEAAREWREKR